MYALTIAGGLCQSFPDVCLTPQPTGPVPIAYPNLAQPPLANPVATKVLIVGSPTVHKGSQIPQSSGDEAGSAGGVTSGRFMADLRFDGASQAVRVQGWPVVRLGDPTRQNAGNAVGTVVQPSQCKVRVAR